MTEIDFPERSPEGASPASPPSASAASAASPRRPTYLPLLWAALTSGNTTLAAAILLGDRKCGKQPDLMALERAALIAERDRIVGEYLAGLIDAAHAVLALKRLGYEGWEARDLLHMAAETAFEGAEK